MATAAEIREEIESSALLTHYEAVDVLWVALLKVANKYAGNDEYVRMRSLVNDLPEAKLTAILNSPSVNALLDLDPPLETIPTDLHERLHPDEAAEAIREVRGKRDNDPRSAMLAFGGILKTIRNKREHGFKSSKGRRDVQILKAARGALATLCDLALAECRLL
ncbi:MAG TPA: hypothetical protein VEK33_20590 [Terriglobales bacterium]|nr:hypothetical protein [Terriglobales bacterium]